ncbi:MAG: radical SAM protein [Chlorobiaceae bacterium]|nr:radical SAM protein [Chlorobiaceae bacterium]
MKAADTILCISPDWRLRYDGNRLVVYKFSIEEVQWMSPSFRDAIALTLFDGHTDLQAITERFAKILCCPLDKAQKAMQEIVSAYLLSDLKILADTSTMTGREWITYEPAHLKLSGQTYQQKKRLDAPLSLLLMPWNSCDTDCIYCYAERKPVRRNEHLTVRRWKELIDEAAEAGIQIATFSGGDPMKHPGILSLIDRLISREFIFSMTTKAHVSLPFASRLLDMGFGQRDFQVSIDAWSDNLADHMVKRPGYKAIAVDSIRNLLRRGIRVRTNSVCTPLNLHDVPNLLMNLAKLGVRKSSIAVYGRSLFRHDDALFLSEEQIAWLRERVEAVRLQFPDYDIKFNGATIDYNAIPEEEKNRRWKERAHCSGGSSSMTICADGRIILCEQMPQEEQYSAGNVKTQGLIEVWNSERMKALAFPPKERFLGTVCEDCEEFDECHYDYGYCFRDALNAYGTVFGPPPNCPKAPESPRFA